VSKIAAASPPRLFWRCELRDFISELSAIPGVEENERRACCAGPKIVEHFARQRALADGATAA
jgi:hypothetical protein